MDDGAGGDTECPGFSLEDDRLFPETLDSLLSVANPDLTPSVDVESTISIPPPAVAVEEVSPATAQQPLVHTAYRQPTNTHVRAPSQVIAPRMVPALFITTPPPMLVTLTLTVSEATQQFND